MTVRLEPGDCLEVMARLKAEGVQLDAVATDPPYHLTSIVKRFGAETAAPAQEGRDGLYARASRGFMGQQWDGGDVAFRPETWRLAFELLKPGGHLVAFSGSRTYHGMTAAIEAAGFEVRDSILYMVASDDPVQRFLATLDPEQTAAFLRCIEESQFGGLLAWIYGTGFPKSHDVAKGIDRHNGDERPIIGRERLSNDIRGGALLDIAHGGVRPALERDITSAASSASAAWEGWGTALKPAWEPIVLARKPLDGSVAANMLKHGTGAINIDGCRIEAGNKTPAPVGQFGGSRIGPSGHSGTRNNNADGLGRWPANIIHDGSDEVLAAFPEQKSGGYPPEGGQRPRGSTYGEPNARGPQNFTASAGSAARFFCSAKADKQDRWGSKHPTVKPVDLMRWLVRLVTPPAGLILDPFAGSGTTGIAALAEGFDAILIEREPAYIADIEARLAWYRGEGAHRAERLGKARDETKAKPLPLFAPSTPGEAA